MAKRTDLIKKHIKKRKVVYSCVITGLGVAIFTTLIMRGNVLRHISRGIPVTASRGIPVTGENVVIGNAFYISSNRQGPPSWVIRCKETGGIFAAQRTAALEMGLPENEISRHLNGVLDHVRGYTFERICMAA